MRVFEVIEQFGNCLELVSMDPNFHNVTVGLFIKNDILTVWSYSKKEGINSRLNIIRDKMVELGGLGSVDEDFKLKVPKGYYIERPLRFLFTQSVEKDPDFKFDNGPISASDNKTKLSFIIQGKSQNGVYTYIVSTQGEHERPIIRIRAVIGGFVKYGECIKLSDESFCFKDKKQHDEYVRILLPYARNVSAVENMITASEQTGQMNTQTLGFSQ